MALEEFGPTLELLSLDACRLAAQLVEAAEAERLRRMTDHGRIALTPAFVASLMAARQLRPRRLGPALAPEPGWSALLALLAARLEGRPALRQSDLARAAGCSTSTLIGRLAAFEARGLVVRGEDPKRGRGTIVALTEDAAARIHDYLREAREI